MQQNATAPKAPVKVVKDRPRRQRKAHRESERAKLDRLRERVRELMHR